MLGRPFPWERWYSPDTPWDAPVEIATLPWLLDNTVDRYASRFAIEYLGFRLTYAEMRAEVDKMAAQLCSLGIGPGHTVALYFPNTPHHPIAFFAIHRVGARAVHLSPLDAYRELSFKLTDSGARTVLMTNVPSHLELAARARDAGLVERVIVADQENWGPPRLPTSLPPKSLTKLADIPAIAPPAWPVVHPDDIALLQYTGGTTGRPKAAILSHANITAAVSIYTSWYRSQGMLRDEAERVICVLPLFHIYGLTSLFLRSFCHGSEILIRPRFDVEATLHDIEVLRATQFAGVPTMWLALLSHPGIEQRDLSSLGVCASGGAPLPVEVEARCERLIRSRLGGGWGMTETSPSGLNIPRTGPKKPGTVGIPLPNVEFDIVALDDPSRTLPPGSVGELRVRGPNVTQGYWNRPEETAAAFVDGRLLTGDLAYMDDEGYFFLVDRKKDLIISGGFNIYPQAIEEAVYEHPDVEEALVIGVPDPYRGEAAKLFVRLSSGSKPFTLEELHAFLADKVGRHELPRELEFRAALPRTAVGKLSKVELREDERRRRDTVAGTPPTVKQ